MRKLISGTAMLVGLFHRNVVVISDGACCGIGHTAPIRGEGAYRCVLLVIEGVACLRASFIGHHCVFCLSMSFVSVARSSQAFFIGVIVCYFFQHRL